jgi:hypothetical protein
MEFSGGGGGGIREQQQQQQPEQPHAAAAVEGGAAGLSFTANTKGRKRKEKFACSGEEFTKLKQSFKQRFNMCVKKSRMK